MITLISAYKKQLNPGKQLINKLYNFALNLLKLLK